jgi:chromosomal replication initiation ATPase DnaA
MRHLNGVYTQRFNRAQRVAVVFDVEVSTLTRGRRGEANQARKVAMYLVKRLCDLTLQETAGHFGVES